MRQLVKKNVSQLLPAERFDHSGGQQQPGPDKAEKRRAFDFVRGDNAEDGADTHLGFAVLQL
jgi:hypothetical protein